MFCSVCYSAAGRRHQTGCTEFTFKKEKKVEEAGECQDGVDPCAEKRSSSSLLSWLFRCGSRGGTIMFCSVALLGRKRRKKKQESGRMV